MEIVENTCQLCYSQFLFYEPNLITLHNKYAATEKNIRTSESSPILKATWLEKDEKKKIKIREMKHFQTNFKSKILKIIKMHYFLRF